MTNLQKIRQDIIDHPSNDWAKKRHYQPIYTASPTATIAIIGQAPGLKAQTSGIPWDDESGNKLVEWLGIDIETLRDDSKIALLPMDF